MKSKCKSCDGKGFLLDTTYDRSGELVECTKCYGTGRAQEAIYRLLVAQRKEARKLRMKALTTER